MITVTISINGQPIFTRSAVNKGRMRLKRGPDGYEVDDGSVIEHRPSDGAVVLAIAMLKTIKEGVD